MKKPFEILIGDCRKVLKTLPDSSVHCVVTSPPYLGLRDYGVEGQIGLEGTIDDFLDAMRDVFNEVNRVLRPDGTLWMNLGDTYKDKELMGIPWKSAFCLQNSDPRWYLRSDIIWHKSNPVPEPDRKRPTSAHEYLFLLTENKKYFYDTDAIRDVQGDEPDPDEYKKGLGSNTGADSLRWSAGYKKVSHQLTHPSGRNKRSVWKAAEDEFLQFLQWKILNACQQTDVWKIPTKGYPGNHFATFPPKLVEPCIMAGTSEKGCCPACGAPWSRITEPSPEYKEKLGASWHDHKDDLGRGQRGVPAAFRGAPTRITTGWQPGCECDAGEPVPCTVLDPFNGVGTTGVVARRLFRNYIGIELNPEYAEEARQRIENDSPLFNLLGACNE